MAIAHSPVWRAPHTEPAPSESRPVSPRVPTGGAVAPAVPYSDRVETKTDWFAYQCDFAERWNLFWDALRQRGDSSSTSGSFYQRFSTSNGNCSLMRVRSIDPSIARFCAAQKS
jgi:hypothetical protein